MSSVGRKDRRKEGRKVEVEVEVEVVAVVAVVAVVEVVLAMFLLKIMLVMMNSKRGARVAGCVILLLALKSRFCTSSEGLELLRRSPQISISLQSQGLLYLSKQSDMVHL